jgi:hypothetical protein
MIATLHRAAALLALAVLPAACANFSAISSGDSSRDVEARVGAPGTVWKNADGSEVWEYPRGPLGVETFMITVGPDHAVREVRQVLSDDYVFKVHPGMSRGEVRRLLGRPGEVASFERRDEEVWSWRYQDAAARYMIFHVVFDRSRDTVRTSFRIDETASDGSHGHGR